jgi:hypothetical protein
MNSNFKYKDILNLDYKKSGKRAPMSEYDRAAQFMPFAALSGFGAVINETSRTTAKKHILNEDELRILNEKLNYIIENISRKPEVEVTYFIPDSKKSGGRYETFKGRVRRLDTFEKEIIFTDKSKIKIENIMFISGEV